MAKAQVELKLVYTVGDNTKIFFNYVNSKRKMRENIGLLHDEDDHITNRVAKKDS